MSRSRGASDGRGAARTRIAELAAGLFIVGLLALSFVWIRGRGAMTPAADRPAVQPPNAASPGLSPSDAPAGAVLADVTASDRTVELGDVRVFLSATPRPLRAFARNRFRFRAERARRLANSGQNKAMSIPLEKAVVSFTMAMPMGDHRHPLARAADGWYELEATLPMCMSGDRRWFGRLDFELDGAPRSIRFAFDLTPPARAGAAPRRPHAKTP